MENIIERLRLEKAEHNKIYRDTGYKDGLEDATSMSYDELLEAVSDVNFYETLVWQNWLEDKIKDLWHEDGAFDGEVYIEGWIAGVKEFWESIKDKL